MKSSIFKISIITVLVLVLVGISQVTAFNMGSFYPNNAPSSDINVIRTQPLSSSATSQSISGVFNLGYPEDQGGAPTTGGLNIRGGFSTSGISVSSDTKISGKLRIAPLSGTADITAITTPNSSSELPQAVSVSGGHIVYDTKKPATTRVACTDNNGVIDTCTGSTTDNTPISGANFPTGSGASVAVSSIQGNTAALWGQVTTANTPQVVKCYSSATATGTAC